jgi:hypothetical protein
MYKFHLHNTNPNVNLPLSKMCIEWCGGNSRNRSVLAVIENIVIVKFSVAMFVIRINFAVYLLETEVE